MPEGTAFPLEKFEKVIRVNLIGAFNVLRLAAAAMAPGGRYEAAVAAGPGEWAVTVRAPGERRSRPAAGGLNHVPLVAVDDLVFPPGTVLAEPGPSAGSGTGTPVLLVAVSLAGVAVGGVRTRRRIRRRASRRRASRW